MHEHQDRYILSHKAHLNKFKIIEIIQCIFSIIDLNKKPVTGNNT